jgi:hypothetical protein
MQLVLYALVELEAAMTPSDRASVRAALEAVKQEIAEHDGWDMHPKDWAKLVQQHIDALGHPAPSDRASVREAALREAAAELTKRADALRNEVPEAMGVAWDIVTEWIQAILALIGHPAPDPPSEEASISSSKLERELRKIIAGWRKQSKDKPDNLVCKATVLCAEEVESLLALLDAPRGEK